MGKKGNKQRQQTRRSIEAEALKKQFQKAVNEGVETLLIEDKSKIDQEQLEMDRAYGQSIADAADAGEFLDDDIPDFLKDGIDGRPFNVQLEDDIPWKDDTAVSIAQKFRVLVERDHLLEYPLLNFMVFINGDLDEEAAFTEMFVRAGCQKAHSLDEADLCVFVGGADVDPQLYGHKVHQTTKMSHPQDNRDLEVYAYCQAFGIPMVGVCRGAQFLHVMNGGMLFQNIDGHNGDHPIYLMGGGMINRTPSVHHQACMPNPEGGMKVLATSNAARTRSYWSVGKKEFLNIPGARPDCEAFFYKNTSALGFQGHPEYSLYPDYTIWCLKMIEQYIRHNPDLGYEGGITLRIRKEILNKRLQELEDTRRERIEAPNNEVEVH